MKLTFILFLAIAILGGCTTGETKTEANTSANADAATTTQPEKTALPPCTANTTVTLSNGGPDITMQVLSAYAVNRIKFNEQTDVGDVAKPGYTLCLADFELDPADPWARPGEGQHKVEVRLLTGDNSPLVPGVYKSAAQGNLQAAPLLYIGNKTHPVLFPKIGSVLVSEVDEVICGEFRVKTIPGLKLEGSFNAPVIDG